MMSCDKTRHQETTQTGVMPRIEIEPKLYRESPTPPLPEIADDATSAKTGEMPVVIDSAEDSKTRDEDTPTGNQ